MLSIVGRLFSQPTPGFDLTIKHPAAVMLNHVRILTQRKLMPGDVIVLAPSHCGVVWQLMMIVYLGVAHSVLCRLCWLCWPISRASCHAQSCRLSIACAQLD